MINETDTKENIKVIGRLFVASFLGGLIGILVGLDIGKHYLYKPDKATVDTERGIVCIYNSRINETNPTVLYKFSTNNLYVTSKEIIREETAILQKSLEDKTR